MTPPPVDLRALLEAATKRAEFTLRSFEVGSLDENNMVVALARDVLALGNSLPHLLDVVEAARLVRAFEQAGGDDWWIAHTKLYAALSALDEQEPR